MSTINGFKTARYVVTMPIPRRNRELQCSCLWDTGLGRDKVGEGTGIGSLIS